MFKYKFVENYSYTKVRLVIGSLSVQAKVTPHPLFEQVKQIHLNNDELNSKCLQLAQNGQVLIPYQKSNLFVKRCKQIMNFTPELNISEIGVNIFLGNGQQDTKILDALQFNDLLSAIKTCFDKIGENLHPKVMRKIKSYIKNSNRSQSQKQTIDIIMKAYKQNQKIVQDAQEEKNQIIQAKKIKTKQKKPTKSQPVNQKIIANNKKTVVQVEQENQPDEDAIINQKKTANLLIPTQDKKMRKQPYKNSQNGDRQPNNFSRQGNKQKRNYSRSNRHSGSKDKRSYSRNQEASRQKYDPKIILGINGDTQAGWRQRNRPPRIPNNYNIPNSNKLSEQKKVQRVFNKPIQAIKQQKNITKLPKVAQKIVEDNLNPPNLVVPYKKTIDNGSMELVFTYPQDGQNYNFTQVKNNFKLFINGKFLVSFKDGRLQIKKGQSGYIRDSKIDIITNGFMAEGLTISLGGSSNLQDGGDTYGDPTIQAFTSSNSQFFHIIILEVYAGVKGFINNGITNERPKASEIQFRNSQVSKQKLKVEQNQIQECQKQQSRSQKQARLLIEALNQSEASKKENNLEQKNEQQSQSKQPQNKKTPNNIQQNKEDSQQYQNQNQQDEQDKHSDKNKLIKIPKDRKHKHLIQKAEQYQDKLQRQIKQGIRKPRGQNKSKSRSQSRSKSVKRDNGKSPRNLKQKLDPQILLGINGDSQSGWRQRNRPSHVHTGNTLTVEPNTKLQNLDEDQKQQREQVNPTTQ